MRFFAFAKFHEASGRVSLGSPEGSSLSHLFSPYVQQGLESTFRCINTVSKYATFLYRCWGFAGVDKSISRLLFPKKHEKYLLRRHSLDRLKDDFAQVHLARSTFFEIPALVVPETESCDE
jgi:hypothetical protein